MIKFFSKLFSYFRSFFKKKEVSSPFFTVPASGLYRVSGSFTSNGKLVEIKSLIKAKDEKEAGELAMKEAMFTIAESLKEE